MRVCTLKEEKRETAQEEMAKAGPGLIKPDMELFCKAAADGASLGDCPFAQNIQVDNAARGREGGGECFRVRFVLFSRVFCELVCFAFCLSVCQVCPHVYVHVSFSFLSSL